MGYIMLFAQAFPLAPFCALLANLIELRNTMNNLAIYQKRYQARPAKGIGLWLKIGEMLTIISVAVNCAIVFYTSEALDNILPVLNINVDLIFQFMIMVGVEHVTIAFKLILSVLIKDKPEWVAQEENEAVE